MCWSVTELWLLENTRMESMGNNSTRPFRVRVFSVCVCAWKTKKKKKVVAQKCHSEDKYNGVFWIQPTTET